MSIKSLTVLLLWCLMVIVGDVHAAATVTVTKATETAYTVSATNVENAAAIDFILNYDAVSLNKPQVVDGPVATTSQAIKVVNSDNPGIVRVVYVVANGSFKESGVLATVTFSKIGTGQVQPPELKTEIVSLDATKIATQSLVFPQAGQINALVASTASTTLASSTAVAANPLIQTLQPVSTAGTAATAAGAATASAVDQKNEQSTMLDQRVPVYREQFQQTQSNTGAAATEAVAPKYSRSEAEKKVESKLTARSSFVSVLDRFRAYQGVRTLKKLSGLFDDSLTKAAGVIQTPAIAVSDGKSLVTVTVLLSESDSAPSFSLKGAHLKSLRHPSEQKWELDALPQKGRLDVRLSILHGEKQVEIPLVVVPPLDPVMQKRFLNMPAAEYDVLFGRVRAKDDTPLYDLNGDGKQDYTDDYILVAHWLLKKQKIEKAATPPVAAPR